MKNDANISFEQIAASPGFECWLEVLAVMTGWGGFDIAIVWVSTGGAPWIVNPGKPPNRDI
tara:strand:+ start:4070 stop:4252 length:183 start_codon:yes stop_codon:yes gene_type:complete